MDDGTERAIVETVPSALLILDGGLRVASANRAFCQTFDTTAAETEGRQLVDLGSGQWNIPALRAQLGGVIAGGAAVEGFEVEQVFPTVGRRIMVLNARRILRHGTGHILLAITDVTAERLARIESKRNWQLTQSIVDTIRDPLVVLEDDMTVVTASKAFLTIFGIADADVRGRSIADLGQHQWDVPALRHLMEQVLPQNKPIEAFEIEDDFPGLGKRVFSLNARKVSQPGNHAHRVLLVFEDITNRKQRERDAETLTNEISHRIKNNLQVIIGLIALESRRAGEACAPGYQAMQGRIGAIAQLYDLLSQSSRGGTVGVDAYLKEIAKTLSATLLGKASGITIEVKADALQLDPDRAVPFGLLVNELATNAVKHAFPDGKGRVTLGAHRAGDQMELTVTDNGIGTKEKTPAKLSEKRGSDYVAIFVRQLGGSVVASPTDGTGTVVTIRLPMLLRPPAGPNRAA
jgi:PAS domain S-box-containing protein